MAIMTSNNKRPQLWLTLNHNHTYPPSPNSQTSKRPRFSPNSTRSNTTVSRISRYPEARPPFHREVHAPCRPRKFDLLNTSTKESIFRVSGHFRNARSNMLLNKYQQARNDALASIRFLEKGKEVVEVDTDSNKDAVSEDSSVQEVHVVEDEHEGPSVVTVTDHKWQQTDVVVTEIQDLDAKVMDGALHHHSTSSVVSNLTNSNMNVVNAVKMLDNLSLSPEHHLSSVQAYKKLLDDVDNRGHTLKRLSFEIQLNEKRKAAFELLRPKKEPVEEVPLEPFVPLTKEEEVEVARAFSAKRKKVLVTHEKSNIEISGDKFQCLRPCAWLNDEVINLYLELLKEREKREQQKFLNCHFFNTFFYKKLISGPNSYDFKSVRRWTSQKKLGYGLHECDKIFVPIHKEVHWCLAVINKKDKKFQYLDSLKGKDTQVLKVLARYFVDEVKDKTGKDVNVTSWEKEFVEDLPEQENGYDCGVFMIKYADFYSRNLGLYFNQEHMPYFRLRTAKEILRLKAD